MSKYILTLLLCLSSHTLSATDHTQKARSLTKGKNHFSYALQSSTTQQRCRPSFWKHFLGYCSLILIGAIAFACIVIIFFGKELKHFLPLFIIDAVVSLLVAFFYTILHKPCKHSLFKHTVGYFALCVIGHLACLGGALSGIKDVDKLALLFGIPFVIAFIFCAISAKLYVDSFKTPLEEEEGKLHKSIAQLP